MPGAPSRFGPYLVLDQVGKGGMAMVHLAENTETGKRVALKRLLPRAAANEQLVTWFLHEAQLLMHLDDKNIATTYDFGRYDGTFYIEMEYVRGPTLAQLVKRCDATIGKIPITITLNIASQICAALDHAHHRCDEHGTPLGIVHRDVCPANIILSETGVVKLIDFGLAKAKVSTADTGEGVIKGKFNYVAPEYLGGQLDARADLWAVGVVMYELLTSRRLFNGEHDWDTMNRVRSLPIPPPSRGNPRVPPALDAVVMSALERDLAKRCSSAATLRESLRAVIAQSGTGVDEAYVAGWVHRVFTQKAPGKRHRTTVGSIIDFTPTGGELALPAEESVRPRGRMWFAIIGLLVVAAAVWLIAAS